MTKPSRLVVLALLLFSIPLLAGCSMEEANSYLTGGWPPLYLLGAAVIGVLVLEWRWTKTCDENIQVLVAKQSGGGEFKLAPKVGGEISLTNPYNNTTRTWPVNELSTIDVLYPGVGFVPAFLQKTIRMAIVNEGDWEPMLNRSAHRENIASPDIVKFLVDLSADTDDPKLQERLNRLVDKISTGPTREMIASPAVLGNLLHEKITEAVITVNKEIVDKISGLVARLDEMVKPVVFYLGMGVILTAVIASIMVAVSVRNDIALIKQSFGIGVVAPTATVPAKPAASAPATPAPTAPVPTLVPVPKK